ncbi:contractile injection system protein, VgrG/Pvc8 family [Acinetobacter sp. 243_ASPC]|uniref:contractile injection system protein, VgrG/Pvc8 family n=1 Tax=Acinetobacter sp. 243_ASPC TaxID=1579345 RepID=UPI0006602302|nr:contractile injection system protein, VgrG/Pvc8 family [Acinetobacter sp. 243_ASPC]
MIENITSLIQKAKSDYDDYAEYPTPIFRIEVEGIDITAKIHTRLMSLSIKDNRGLVVDSVDIELDDSDGKLSIPPKGAKIQVWLGWSNTGLIDKGVYKVESTSHRGAPDVLTITAFSNDVSEGLKQKRERAWSNLTIQQIFETIGDIYNLKVIIHEKFASQIIKYIAQNESDANLITRIADEHDAIATVKNGHLILLPRGASQTASGLDLPQVTINRQMGDQHNYTNGTGTDSITGVKAYYYVEKKAKKLHVTVGDSEDNVKEIRYIHRDKTTAELAANAEYNRCKRSAQKLTYSLALGNPQLIPEQEFVFVGLKPEIDDIIWLGTNLTHTLNDSGLTTTVELEVQLPEADDVSTLFEGKEEQTEEEKKKEHSKKRTGRNYADYTGVIVFYREKGKDLSLKSGNQTKPLRPYIGVYQSKKIAMAALKREQARIDKAKKGK